MTDYIKREDVLRHKRKMSGADFGGEFWDEAVLCEDIRKIPTADVAEVKHGKWVLDSTRTREDGDTYDYCCSLCGGEAHAGEYGNNDVLADFCHHCGADMRSSEEK